MAATDLHEARSALRAGRPAALLGLRECSWLDAKREPYRLREPKHVEELAKDVAAFANTSTGGLIVIGIGTRAEDGAEILERLVPFDRSSVDTKQYSDLVRERVTPAPRGVTVAWSDCDDGSSVFFIDVPEQPPANFPYVVAAPVGKPGRVNPSTVAVPIRESDHTHWLPREEIHRLLHNGWTAAGMPGLESLTQMVQEAVSRTHDESFAALPRIGQGMEAGTADFQAAYAALRRRTPVGAAMSEVFWDSEGRGAFQHLAPASPSHPAWVLCSVPSRRAMAVAQPVWDALMAAGGGTTTTIGYPETGTDRSLGPVVFDEDVKAVDVTAGKWGPGRLVRRGAHTWIWEPKPGIGFGITRGARDWTGEVQPPQLRLRALVTLPLANASELEITAKARRDLVNSDSLGVLTGVVAQLNEHRGRSGTASWPATASGWEAGPHRNALNSASYSSTVPFIRGSIATIEAMVALPHSLDSALVTCVDLRVDGVDGWHRTRTPPPIGQYSDEELSGTRITLEEVVAILFAGWAIAASTLPTLAGVNLDTPQWTGPPTVELRLSAERPCSEAEPDLKELIDFSRFGPAGRQALPGMAVTVTAPPRMDEEARLLLVRQALVRMGQAFGFIEAEEL
ncbi:RNA-binding domain-containing protein [Streptomyces sp. NPDC002809]|uniref:RNA-binding domain-containing protein n=1 Tax=Streptomyces sp. NPDC002809 TaxID=3154433 RepID=UPI00331E24DB